MTSSPATSPRDERLPSARDVLAAARALRGLAVPTPLLEAPALNERLGARLLVKAEALQLTGSFKFRGAYNRISRLSGSARKAGVVAYSSGNHAQGVAAAARIVGVPALIVMPSDAPATKIEGTKAWGAEVVFYERGREDRRAIAQAIAAKRGALVVPSYDDFHVIAGQGTVGLEIAREAAARGLRLDAVLIPCGGGGLSAGCALALERHAPGAAVYAVEPQGFDDTRRSLEAGERIGVSDPDARTFCDALLAPMPGELTFPINAARLAGGLTVDDKETAHAMAAAQRHLKLVLEPGGAVALAALLAGKFDGRGKTVAVIASGGNVDAGTYCAALKGAETA